MKTRILIIVGIIAIGIISIFVTSNGHDLFHYMNLPYEWHDSFGLTDKNIVRSSQCAELFDKIFDTWKEYVDVTYGGPGQPILEPPSVAGLIADWEGGEEFRDSNCRYTVNDWAYLVEHREQIWGHVDWPKLKPFSYIKSELKK